MIGKQLATDSLESGTVARHLTYWDTSIPAKIEATAAKLPERVCIDFMGTALTYEKLSEHVSRVAAGLLKLGLRSGERIAILLPNCPENIIATLAAQRIGLAVVQHNPLYPTDELEPMFLDHGARVVVAWDNSLPAVMPLRQRTGVEHIFGVDITRSLPLPKRLALRLPLAKTRNMRSQLTAGGLMCGCASWESLFRHGALPSTHSYPASDATAVIMYTSGTTGRPKGVPLTHANLLANCKQGLEWTGLALGTETFLSVLPMFHAFGLTLGSFAGLCAGATVVTLPSPDPSLMVAAMKRRPATFLVGVPPLLDAFLTKAKERHVRLQSLRTTLCGAMSLPPEFVAKWEKTTGGMLIEGYGLTETSPVIVGNPLDSRRRAGSIGIPFPDTDVRIVDPKNPQNDVLEGEEGELIVRGPQVFSGYLNKPLETAEAFIDDWFRTGDLARVTDGFIVLTGRLKDIIITGGFNVSPLEVEDALRRHPRIRDISVIGIPGTRRGEDVVAAIVPEGELPSNEELRAWAKQHLAAYKVPRRFVSVEELPTNAMRKVVRTEVVALIQRTEAENTKA
ncbi:Long-chain-fatty-acid--CoA ligase [Dermatophilus congolensis]|uniref:Long-chain-fatty-acid--CoA ligase n=1 Tax=Dermatophilus congolensis TaxID=1863 RepID=A0AA46H061_9MICO|nr:AMP-binding protein [Dermatophilus congolensis]STD08016.1 Long-chain-fatty-acid--CoA ligase [Dermatophilus congolensis]